MLLAALLLSPPAPAHAQGFPSRPVRIVVPFPAGGSSDVIAHALAERLGQRLGQPVAVEFVAGPQGRTGLEAVVRAEPDGHTLLLGQTTTLAINPAIDPNLAYDPARDLVPVVLVAYSPFVLAVARAAQPQTLGDLVTAARERPGALTLGSPGPGSLTHLTGALLQATAGIRLTHRPVESAALTVAELVERRVDLVLMPIPTMMPHIQAGTVRPLAVTSLRRSPALASVPTVAEQGHPGFDAVTWYGLLAPAGTPRAVVDRLNEDVNGVLATPAVRDAIRAGGGDVIGGAAEAFSALLRAEHARWSRIVRGSGIKLD